MRTFILYSGVILFVSVCLLFEGCKNEPDPKQLLLDDIAKLEMKAEENLEATLLLSKYDELLGILNPPDTLWDQVMWKKGQTLRFVGESEKSVETMLDLYRQGGTMAMKENALFMAAFTEDEDVNNDLRARSLYQQFLSDFQDSPKREQVETLLSYIGKSNEEILKELQQN